MKQMVGFKPRWRAPGRGSTLLLALLALDMAGVAFPKRVRGTPASVPECEGFRIAVLDLNELSEAASVPRCTLSDVHVNVKNGVVYSSSMEIEAEHSVAHSLGTHSAPYFLRGAIQASKYYTTNLDEADLILVYDYCHYIVWLGNVHAYGSTERWLATPGDSLTATYREMMKLPVWKKHDGAQFVFYDAHPGFFNGKASMDIGPMRCEEFKKGIHIIVDTPMRNVCEKFWEMKNRILVTPYVPNPLDRENPRAYLQQEFRGLKDRPIFAYCRSTCDPYQPPSVNAGKLMRYFFSVKVWGDKPEMDVRCTDRELSNEGHLPFTEMYNKMRSATFCPAFPGDAASTRRLSEMFLAGCIPVFLGPPYHSMPFSETVPYKQLGVFFNITDTRNWLMWEDTMKPMKMEWQYHPTQRASHETEARWWIPDTPIDDVTIHVDNADQVLDKLKGIPPEVLEAKLRLMHDYGTRFSFLKRLTTPPNAVNSLMAGMCQKQQGHPSRQTLQVDPAAQAQANQEATTTL